MFLNFFLKSYTFTTFIKLSYETDNQKVIETGALLHRSSDFSHFSLDLYFHFQKNAKVTSFGCVSFQFSNKTKQKQNKTKQQTQTKMKHSDNSNSNSNSNSSSSHGRHSPMQMNANNIDNNNNNIQTQIPQNTNAQIM